MKKSLLLSLSAFALSLSVNAQQKFVEETERSTPVKFNTNDSKEKSTKVLGDASYYYLENNSRTTHEINTFITAHPSTPAVPAYDTTVLYTYNVKQKVNTHVNPPVNYWQKAIQAIPTTDTVALTQVKFLGVSLKASSNVICNVYKNSLAPSALLGTKSIVVSSTYGYQTVTFDSPILSNDTILVVLEMATVADSFAIAKCHNEDNGWDFGTSPSVVFNSALPFKGDAQVLAFSTSYGSILGTVQQNFDFYFKPYFNYNLKSHFTASKTNVCLGDAITFTNTGDTSLVRNPIFNYFAWNKIANGADLATTSFDLGNSTPKVYPFGQTTTYTYPAVGTYSAKAKSFIGTWILGNKADSTIFTITVNSTATCAGLDETGINTFSVYPNPANDMITVNFSDATFNDGEIRLMSTEGKVIESKKYFNNASQSFDVSTLTSGVYFIQVGNAIEKVVIQ